MSPFSTPEVAAYATQRPSGEKTGERANVGLVLRSPKGAAFPSCSIHSDLVGACARVITVNNSVVPSGDQDAGMWSVSFSAVVSRSARAVPSARCQKMP